MKTKLTAVLFALLPIALSAADCSNGNIPSVPDTASTLVLLGSAAASLLLFRKKFV